MRSIASNRRQVRFIEHYLGILHHNPRNIRWRAPEQAWHGNRDVRKENLSRSAGAMDSPNRMRPGFRSIADTDARRLPGGSALAVDPLASGPDWPWRVPVWGTFAREYRGSIPGWPVCRRPPGRSHRPVGGLVGVRRRGARRSRSLVPGVVRSFPRRAVPQRESDRRRPDLAGPPPPRMDGQSPAAEPHRPRPGGCPRRLAVPRRSGERARECSRRRVAALRAWSRSCRVKALASAARPPPR